MTKIFSQQSDVHLLRLLFLLLLVWLTARLIVSREELRELSFTSSKLWVVWWPHWWQVYFTCCFGGVATTGSIPCNWFISLLHSPPSSASSSSSPSSLIRSWKRSCRSDWSGRPPPTAAHHWLPPTTAAHHQLAAAQTERGSTHTGRMEQRYHGAPNCPVMGTTWLRKSSLGKVNST